MYTQKRFTRFLALAMAIAFAMWLVPPVSAESEEVQISAPAIQQEPASLATAAPVEPIHEAPIFTQAPISTVTPNIGTDSPNL